MRAKPISDLRRRMLADMSIRSARAVSGHFAAAAGDRQVTLLMARPARSALPR